MLLSRRNLVTATAVAIPSLVLASASPAIATTITPGKNLTNTVYSGALNTRVIKSVTPSSLASSGASWYQRINTRVSGNSYYSLLLFSKGTTQIGLKLEKTVNGVTVPLVTKYASARLTGSPLRMEFKTRLPDLSGELYQDGQKLTDVNYSETDAVLTGEDVTSSVYVGGTQAIDFKEEVTVIPFDTPAGTLNPGPQWALRFDENFDGPAIDLNKWNVQDSSKALQYATEKEAYAHGVSSIAPGNTYSVNTADCVEIKDGNAVFKLEKLSAPRIVDGIERTHKGAYLDTSHPFKDEWHNRDVSKSAKFSAKFMRVEIRAKMPSGLRSDGNHAALWLRPDQEFIAENADATTPSLEIDINEFYGHNYTGAQNGFDTTERTEATVHFDQTGKNKTGGDQPQYGIRWVPSGEQKLQDEFHIWTMELTPTDGINIYFDNTPLVHVPADDPRLIAAKNPEVKMHLRLNFEAGTMNWGKINESVNDLSGRMIVDYVRAWEYIQ